MIVGLFPQKPHHARGFDPHQDRLAMEEDFVETAHQHQRPAGAIQLLENHARGDSRRLGPSDESSTDWVMPWLLGESPVRRGFG